MPYKTLDNTGLLKCIEIRELIVDDKLLTNKYLLGISPIEIEIKGAKCILPNLIEEELK